MKKYFIVTFLLWLIGGWCGLHHFYLGRDRHGFLWATSWGGFLIGWLKEFTSLSRYTEEANRGYPIRAARRPATCSELHRILGMLVFGCFYRMLIFNAIPEAIPSNIISYRYCILALAPLGTAFGTYLVANVGHITCSIYYPVIGSYIGEVCFGELHLFADETNIVLVAIVSSVFCVVGWRERQRNVQMSVIQRFLLWAGLGMLIIFLWGSYGYHNAEVHVEELGGNVKLRDVIKVFFASQEWIALKTLLKQAFWELWENGWDFSKAHVVFSEGVAVSQLRHASKVIGLEQKIERIEELTEKELKFAYKKSVKEWHPDKHQNNKEYAQERFIEIQEAYKLLERHLKMKRTTTTKS